MIAHASGEAEFAIAVHGVGGHGDDGEVGEAGIGADGFCGGDAIHNGHLHVHEDDVVVVFGDLLNSSGAVFGEIDLDMGVFEEAGGDFAIEFVVLDEKNASAVDGSEVDFAGAVRLGVGGGRVSTTENFDDGVEEHGRGNRLDEDVFERGLLRLAKNLFAAVGGDHDEVRGRGKVQSEDLTAGFDAVDARHLPVDEDDVVRLLAIGGLADEFDTFAAGSGFIDDEGHAEQHAG